jgi:hypothetical protein
VSDSPPRFEFRAFGRCFDAAEQHLRTLTPCGSITESWEIYLVGRNSNDNQNVKIRDGRLETKRLVEHYRDLERWQPAGQWTFPVRGDVVRNLLSSSDIAEDWRAVPSLLSKETFLTLVTQPGMTVYRANVFKRRFRFSLDPCRAEVDHILVNGAAVESVALESQDPQAVLELRTALKLEDRENVSYPLALSRISGIRPLPGEERYG